MSASDKVVQNNRVEEQMVRLIVNLKNLIPFCIKRDISGHVYHHAVPRIIHRQILSSLGQICLGKQCRPRSRSSLPFSLHLLDALLYGKATLFEF